MDGHDARPEPGERPSPRSPSTPPRARCSEAPGCPPFPRHTQPQRDRDRAREPEDPRLAVALQRARPRSSTRTPRRSTFTVHFDAGSDGEVAQAVVDDTTGESGRGLDGPAGRLDDGARLPLRVRATHQRPVDLARAVRGVPGRAASTCAGCSRGARLDLLVLLSSVDLARVLQPGPRLLVGPARVPAARVPARAGSPSSACAASGGRRFAGSLPLWVLAGAAIFLIGFRGGLDRYDSNVIDVGYAGVVGADRLISGDTPYGTFPTRTGATCGITYADGTSQAYRQAAARQPLREPDRARRHLRPDQLRRLRAGGRGARLDGPVGRPAGRAR